MSDLEDGDSRAPRGRQRPQTNLFGDAEPWEKTWEGMPEFVQDDFSPFKTIYVHFESYEDVKKFAELVGQSLTIKTRSIWYPEAEIGRMMNKRWGDNEEGVDPMVLEDE